MAQWGDAKLFTPLARKLQEEEPCDFSHLKGTSSSQGLLPKVPPPFSATPKNKP